LSTTSCRDNQGPEVVRHERHPNAVDAQADHLGRPARSQFRLEPAGGKPMNTLQEQRLVKGV
ncbi:MAG: hypothetical protein WBC80_28170, partial [Isosphaeraceae bacterium]